MSAPPGYRGPTVPGSDDVHADDVEKLNDNGWGA